MDNSPLIADLIAAADPVFKLKPGTLKAEISTLRHVDARRAVIWMAKHNLDLPATEIARVIDRDAKSVRIAVHAVDALVKKDPAWRLKLDRLWTLAHDHAAKRTRIAQERCSGLSGYSAPDRDRLASHARSYAARGASQKTIARYLGVTPEIVTGLLYERVD